MYEKHLYVPDKEGNRRAVIRRYGERDMAELIRIQQESFPPPFPEELWWNEEQLQNHIALFPEGALCIEVDGVVAGSMTGLLKRFDPARPEHTWAEATDNGYIRSHEPDGDTLYIVDLCIRPAYRRLDLGRQLMQAMCELVVHRGLTRLLGGGRMPGYGRVANEQTPESYLQAVARGELRDPVLTFLLRCGRTPLGVVRGYLEDEESQHCAALMEWRNPFLPRRD